jgi:hypothetical protein
MDTIELCHAEADDCLRRADIDSENDRPLWITLAHSWLQLAEHADRISSEARSEDDTRDEELQRAVEAALI